MKLLPPKELNTKLNDQKKTEIEAGMFLAKKIDKLREDLTDTQKETSDETERIKKEFELFIIDQSKSREIILKEIEILEQKRRNLRIPLDTEWERIKKESDDLDIRTNVIVQKEIQLSEIQNKNISLSQDLLKRQSDVMDSEIQSKNYLEFAFQKKTEAQKIISGAEKYETEIKKNIEIRTKTIEKREKTVAYREIDLENNRKNLLDKERELNLRERRLVIKENAHN